MRRLDGKQIAEDVLGRSLRSGMFDGEEQRDEWKEPSRPHPETTPLSEQGESTPKLREMILRKKKKLDEIQIGRVTREEANGGR